MITSLPPADVSNEHRRQRVELFGGNKAAAPAIARRAVRTPPVVEHREPFVRYLPTDRPSASDSLCVTGVGCADIRPGDAYPLADHPNIYQLDWRAGRVLPEFQVVLLTDGRGEFETRETGLVRFQGQALLFLFPGVWHRFRPDPTVGWKEQWVSLNGPLVRRLFSASGVSPSTSITCPENAARLGQQFERLMLVARQTPIRQSQAIKQVATHLLSDSLGVSHERPAAHDTCSNSATEPVHDPIVDQAREVIWSHPHKRPLSVNDVARRLPVTRRTLDRRFAQVLGHSVLDEINACRLSRAKRMLVETDFLVKTVSYLAGFPSRERMRLLFLNEEGMTPTEYRERSIANQ